MSEHERRRHRRYPLRMSVQLLRGDQKIEALVVNASVGGCLLLLQIPLEVGEKLVIHLPQLHQPSARLHVLRTQRTQEEWVVATCFETALADEEALARLAQQFQLAAPEEQPADGQPLPPRVLH